MKLLIFAHTPPPHHGQSYMVKLMLDGLGGDRRRTAAQAKAPSDPGKKQPDTIECYHVNAQLSEDMEDIGVFRFQKGLMILFYCIEAIWCRFRYGIRNFYYVPAPGKRAALYRDWMVMLLCRPFFDRFIYHWHAVGLGDWLHSEGTRLECWITHFLLDHSSMSIVLAVPSMRDALRLKAHDVKIVPNGIPDPCPAFDEEILPRRKLRTAARKTLIRTGTLTQEERVQSGGDPEVFKVFYLAHCIREKGLFDTVDAVALANEQLRASNSPMRIQLTIAGAFLREEEEKEFQARLTQPDLNTGEPNYPFPVKYAGFVSGSEKEQLFRESDGFCFPTYYSAEGQPVNLIEAMAFALSIVTTRWRGIPDILSPEFPYFVEPKQPRALATALIRSMAAEDPSMLRQYFLDNFALEKHLEGLKNAFLKVENLTRPTPPLWKKYAYPVQSASQRRKLNILVLFSRYEHYGGEEGSVFRIADAVQDHHNVEFLLGSTKEMLEMPLHEKITWPMHVFNNRKTDARLERYQEIGRFDIWQVHNVFPALSPVVYKKAFEWGIPVIHFLHNYRFGCTNGFLLSKGKTCERCIHGNFLPALYRKSWRNSYVASGAMGAVLAYSRHIGVFEKISQWIALSHAQKDKHVEMGIPADKIVVIHHFLEPDSEPPPPSPEGYALFLGRLSPEKGVDQLLDAWKILNRTDRQLVILGDGPEAPKLKAQATALGLKNVRFEGFKNKVEQRQIWAGAAFSVATSLWLEGCPMVVLESWAKKRPVVTNRIGALAELVTDGVTGYYAEPWQPESLAAALSKAFDSPAETAEMGHEGYLRLVTHFTKQIWLEKMQAVYSSVRRQ